MPGCRDGRRGGPFGLASRRGDGQGGNRDYQGDHGQRQAGSQPIPAAPPPAALEGAGAASLQGRTLQVPLQVVGHRAGGEVAGGAIPGDRFEDDRLQVARDGRIELARRHGRAVHDTPQCLPPVAIERLPQGQQFIERQSQAVDVAADIRLALKPLRGRVLECAGDLARSGQRLELQRLGHAEIGYPDGAGRIDQQVCRLNVAVQGSPGMGVVDGPGRLLDDAGGDGPVSVVHPRRRLAGRPLPAVSSGVAAGVDRAEKPGHVLQIGRREHVDARSLAGGRLLTGDLFPVWLSEP
jgi:hypothetical protein